MKSLTIVIFSLLFPICGIVAQHQYTTERGHASFFSKAPVADVNASNEKVKVNLHTKSGEVSFHIAMADFIFKNKKMGRDAERNYIETQKYQEAEFKGKIEGEIDFDKPGTYAATAMGKLKIHGVSKDIKEKGKVIVSKGKIRLVSQFNVALKDYNIETPKILGKKMTEENILVKIDATLTETDRPVLSKKKK